MKYHKLSEVQGELYSEGELFTAYEKERAGTEVKQ